MITARPTTTQASVALVVTTALAPAAWGLTYAVTTELLPAHRPLLAGVLRALPAGLVLAAVTRQRPRGEWWLKALVLGTLNIGAFFALLFVAASRLPGGVAATLGATQPLIAAALASVLLRERLHPKAAAAGLLGVLGVALLVLRAGAHLDALGVLAGSAGAVSMATGVVLTKRWGRPVPLLAFTSWQLIAGGLVLLPVALASEGLPPHLSGRNVLGFLWLATGGTAIAYALWFRGIGRLPVARVSVLGLLSPVVATVVGWTVLHQSMTLAQTLGMLLVAAAILLGQRAGAAQARADVPRSCPSLGATSPAMRAIEAHTSSNGSPPWSPCTSRRSTPPIAVMRRASSAATSSTEPHTACESGWSSVAHGGGSAMPGPATSPSTHAR